MSKSQIKWIVKKNSEEATNHAYTLQSQGWDVYEETVPLHGQKGYFCVNPKTKDVQNVVWNIYKEELLPIIVDLQTDAQLLEFFLQHGKHESFGYFEWGDKDNSVGFICHCNHAKQRSSALRIKGKDIEGLHQSSQSLLSAYKAELEEEQKSIRFLKDD